VDRETGELIKPCGDAAWSSVMCCDLHCYRDAIAKLYRGVKSCAAMCGGVQLRTIFRYLFQVLYYDYGYPVLYYRLY
jgi:hypothetical protein